MQYIKKPKRSHALLFFIFPKEYFSYSFIYLKKKPSFFTGAFFIVFIETANANPEIYLNNLYLNIKYYCQAQPELLISSGDLKNCKNETLDTEERMRSGEKFHNTIDLISVSRLHSLSRKTFRCMYRKCHLQCIMNNEPDTIRSEKEKCGRLTEGIKKGEDTPAHMDPHTRVRCRKTPH